MYIISVNLLVVTLQRTVNPSQPVFISFYFYIQMGSQVVMMVRCLQ